MKEITSNACETPNFSGDLGGKDDVRKVKRIIYFETNQIRKQYETRINLAEVELPCAHKRNK